MSRALSLVFVGTLLLSSCSSVGIYNLQKKRVAVHAPSRIVVEPFSAPLGNFQLGDRSDQERSRLRNEIVAALASRTAGQLRTHAADAAVRNASNPLRVGTWLVRGQILEVDQGSRALRATVGLGAGRTTMRTRVTVYEVTSAGLIPLIRFNTTGSSGLEPGAALGVAAGGVGTAMAAGNAAASVVLSGLPGVSTDVERTSYETAAVISAYLERLGLLDRSRISISPNMKGQLPSTVNLSRAIPEPLRSQN